MLRGRIAPPLAVLTVVVVVALVYAPRPAASQDVFSIPQEDRDNANTILGTDAARFLSGDGINALNFLSGKLPRGLSASSSSSSAPGTPPPISSRFDVMVNNPAEDTFALFDVSSQSETAVAGFGSTVVVAFNDSSGAVFPNHSFMGFSRSTDGGVTFTDLGNLPVPPTGFNEGDPGLVVDRSGNFYASSISFDSARPPAFRDTVGISKSTNGGASFGQPVYLPAAGVLPNSFQDKSFIAVDTTSGPTAGNVYVTFTSFPAVSAGQLPIMFSRSTNGGSSFSVPIQISALGTINQGSEPVVGASGEIYVAWLQFSGPGGTGIVVAKSINGGLSFGAPLFVAPVLTSGFGSGEMTGNFRVNSFPRLDVDSTSGAVYLTYGGRSGVPGDSGDVFFVRSTTGGVTWSAPLRVNDDLGNNDQFFPDLAVNSQGNIRIYWYDKRRDPNNLAMTLYTSTSADGGLTFAPNQPLINATFLPGVGYDPELNPTYMGDYIDIKAGFDASGRTAVFLLAWTDCRRVVTTADGVHPDQDVFFTRK